MTSTPTPKRPPLPAPQRLILRLTGLLALLLFLTPTVYVLKYYTVDRPREDRRAASISTSPLNPAVPLDSVAPPLPPPAPGNAAAFYAPAIQSYADRTGRAAPRDGLPPFPTPAETAALLEGSRRADCRFFVTDAHGQPLFHFRDPDMNGATVPYRDPITDREKYRYLSAAVGLAKRMSEAAATAPRDDPHRALLAQAIIRFGDGIGREKATYTHVQVALIIKRLGLALLSPRAKNLQAYVDAQEQYKEAIEAKYARLEADTPDNLLLQAKTAEHDADPMWRREAVWALGATLALPGVNWRRPLETLSAKATLAQVAARDPDPTLRAAAAQTLGQIAQHGAVIQR